MGSLIDHDALRRRALLAAVDAGRAAASDIGANAVLGSLSEGEFLRLAEAVTAGWIRARARQASEANTSGEELIQTLAPPADGSPMAEAWELGAIERVLGPLGELCAERDLTEKPIGAWNRADIDLFVWATWRLVAKAMPDKTGAGAIVSGRRFEDPLEDEIPFDDEHGSIPEKAA